MKVRILPSSPGASHLQPLISFVVNDRLAIDAGCLGLDGTPQEQSAVTDVVLTHSHADHVFSLPIFAMNVCDVTGRGVTVHATAPTLESLQEDVFNWRVWPDFTALKQDGRPLVALRPIVPREAMSLDGLTITAIPVNHPVPTVAYIVDDGASAVLFAIDTGLTEEVWAVAGRHPRLTAAFVDAAFPDRLSALADISGHLTPRLLGGQVAALPARVARLAVHLKPAYHEQVLEDLERADIAHLSVGRIGHDYEL